MKFITPFLILLLSQFALHAQPSRYFPSRIYIVRHAEKENGDDPALTADGRHRAGDLMRKLRNENIRAVYVSQFRRTQMTADSMRIQLHIDTLHYLADTLCNDLLSRIISHHYTGSSILIVAHSNTIPKIIRKLGVADYPQQNIPDEEFDNLFLVRYKNRRAWVKKTKYGTASHTSAHMNPR